MNRHTFPPSSRRLRLEQLEHRALLAGGVLALELTDVSDVTGSADALQSSQVNSSIAIAETRSPAAQTQAAEAGRRTFQPAEAADTTTQRPNLAASPIISTADTTSDSFAVEPSAATDASIQATANEDVVSAETVSAIDARFAAFEAPSKAENVEAFSDDPEETVDLSGLLRSPARLLSEAVRDDDWLLDADTIPRLRQTLDVTANEFAELTDTVITEWYDIAGGMVALDHVQLPQDAFPLQRAAVEVHLESTLMLYRSLTMFSSSSTPQIALPASGEISGPVLDAIMATLGELATSETQPLASSPAQPLPLLAYPATAIAAAGAAAAIAARHRAYSQKTRPQTSLGPHPE
ncbi:hypothetical protein [Roseimaritima ulvae]|uniref:Uncharacterized protein n=1 Tax=Roseimaritima ulvae TaxID=980254 RepID=A0A5B9QTF9_9BACT|nr:hypothetical protein [Roseimaritima ulvae]QEG41030.1 hypothetical protein UC8_30480 [Roseimaritima ulvae]